MYMYNIKLIYWLLLSFAGNIVVINLDRISNENEAIIKRLLKSKMVVDDLTAQTPPPKKKKTVEDATKALFRTPSKEQTPNKPKIVSNVPIKTPLKGIAAQPQKRKSEEVSNR